MSVLRKPAEPKVDPGLAHWMQRARIPTPEIASSFGVGRRTVELALVENRVRLKVLREQARRDKISNGHLAWCPEYLRADYHLLKRKLGSVEARTIIELRIIRGEL